VRFVTEKPWPGLIDRIAGSDFLPMPPKALKEQGVQALAAKPIGTGAFRFVQWVRDEKLVVERNPDYWQTPAEATRVTFRFIPEFSARLAALLAGEIDVMKDVPPQNVEMLQQSGKARLRATVSSRINYLALVNLKPGPMQDLRVRKAIHHAVNVDELIQQVLKGRATKMCGSLSPINVDYSPKIQCLKYDPTQAQALFKEAGGPDQAAAHPRHPVGPLSARQGRLARHRGPAPAHRHQDQRGGQRVGHPPRQDQEPHHR